MHREAKQKHNNAADKQSDKDKEEEGTIYTHWAGWEHKKGGDETQVQWNYTQVKTIRIITQQQVKLTQDVKEITPSK